ncbi:hypothetical protein SAY87_013819 [Trapa incisa]|uniref:Uncharacterized protein n=1 Tax=Trapa incisa TaxID=236973 RepID=A0AAN7KCK1_9MYRT|nr:hypothetical protein SAY87_013819 [Trapa incisa]
MSSSQSPAQGTTTKGRAFWGWLFLAAGSISFLGFLYAAIISKLLPPSDNPIVSAIQKDNFAEPCPGWNLEDNLMAKAKCMFLQKHGLNPVQEYMEEMRYMRSNFKG